MDGSVVSDGEVGVAPVLGWVEYDATVAAGDVSYRFDQDRWFFELGMTGVRF